MATLSMTFQQSKKFIGVFVSICIATVLPLVLCDSGPCEFIEKVDWLLDWDPVGPIKTCNMHSTVIDSTDFLITSPRDEAVGGFYAHENRNLEHLPSNFADKFPNLFALSARFCSIKEIPKKIFKGLNKLRGLWLNNNRIEKIDDDTFDYIPALDTINLASNKIKKLNSRAFASLSRLTTVELNNNDCIDETFKGARIVEMPRVVNKKCGFRHNLGVQSGAPKLNGKACGVPKKATFTIVRGENFDRGDFPWMVALYRRSEQKRPEYICGASVISDRHVLTAAHCLENLLPRHVTALFGAYNLNDQFEVDRFAKSPSRIFRHDHWNPRATQFDADIAVLLMIENIFLSTFVQAICLWESQTAPMASVGIVAGWGQSQATSYGHEIIPTKLQLPIHTNENCFLAHPELAIISSNRTFCAGSSDGRGPCLGDSGSGFYISVGNVFYLRGIVSAAWDVTFDGECLLKKFTIYTDVLKFRDWIDQIMTSS